VTRAVRLSSEYSVKLPQSTASRSAIRRSARWISRSTSAAEMRLKVATCSDSKVSNWSRSPSKTSARRRHARSSMSPPASSSSERMNTAPRTTCHPNQSPDIQSQL
jgi:hypothetical protein